MGVPLAGLIVAAGYPVTVWSRTPASRQRLVQRGAAEAASAAACAAGADVLFTSITDDAALRALLLGPDGALASMRPGAILVETSTVSLDASAEVAAAAEQRGVPYLRLPISGNAASAQTGQVTALVSGPAAAWEAVRPVVEAFSVAQVYLGGAEEARAMKLVVNAIVVGTGQLLAESLALGQRLGLEPGLLLDTLSQSAAASPWLKAKAALLKERDFTPTMTTRLILKDVDLILGAAAAEGVPMPLTAATRQLLQMLIGEGGAEEDFISLVRLAERHAGIDGTVRETEEGAGHGG